MKTMKKLWISICSLAFAIAFGAGVATAINVQPKQAEAESTLGTFDVGLSMTESELKNNGVLSQYNSRFLYLAIENGGAIHSSGNWDVKYTSVGDAVKVNGVTKSTTLIKTKENAGALALLDGAIDLGCTNVGDTLTIDGEFTNETYGTFTVKEATFIFDGYTWMEAGTMEYSLGAYAGSIDGYKPENGFYVTMEANELPNNAWTRPVKDDAYVLTRGGESTTFSGSMQKVDAGRWHVGFRNNSTGGLQGDALEGDVVTLGGWFYFTEDYTNYTFFKVKTAQYEYENGAWKNITPTIEIKQNGEIVDSNIVYIAPNTKVDTITATSSSGSVQVAYEAAMLSNGAFVLRAGESISDYRVTHYVAQNLGVRSVYFLRETIARVGFTDFVMEEGASVRVTGDKVNGLRFTAEMSENTYDALQASNAEYGMVIVPKDYITDGYELTVQNLFGANPKYSATAAAGASQAVRRMLLLEGLTPSNQDDDGNYEIRGAITDILTANITREFVGVAYAKVDDAYMLAAYYGDDMENNARSIYYVSQKAIDAGDNASALQEKYINEFDNYVSSFGKTYNRTYTVNYIKTVNGKSEVETITYTAPLNSPINLTAKEISGFKVSSAAEIHSKLYANKDNVFNFYYTLEGAPIYDSIAWYHPPLDASNNYDNATNDAIAQTMKNGGFTTVLLGGRQNVAWDSDANVAAMRNIIDMFYRNGIKTILSTGNWMNNEDKYHLDYVPDFSNHEGFAGFFAWDEPLPTEEALNGLATYAEWYKSVYADVEVPFMVNLNPSYSSLFNGSTEYGELDYTTYPEYIAAYCEKVLSKFDGTSIQKFLSVDTYPINNDGTLRENFLYDMAVLKAYAVDNEAHMQVVLQACGYGGDDSVAPTEEQFRLQLYTALVFGADNVSWWAYAPTSDINDAPLDQDGNPTDVYDAIQAVNSELATFGSLFKDYAWQGVFMSSPSKGFFGYGADAQYKAYQMVKEEAVFGGYLFTSADDETESFSSITGSGSNYIVSYMMNEDGNEGFVAVNYSAIKDNKTLKLTFTGKELGQYAIYKNGKMETVQIGTSGYTLTLAPGEGAFIVPANSEHTVTFKNWDGTVLQEETLSFGSVPEYKGETPTKARYQFTGWTPAIGAISGDTVYTALFEPAYVTYENGASIGQINLPTGIPMSMVEGKALHFEFKFASDTGSFGFQVMGLEWNRITDIIIIEKTANGITAKVQSTNKICGRIVELGDGWYAWELNKSEFNGEQAATAPTIDFIYPRQNVTGTLYIDWNSLTVVDAYASRYVATKYENGETLNGGANYVLPTPIPMSALAGKALRFEFKFASETGSFAFSLSGNDWLHITNIVTITKTASGFTVTDSGNVNKPCGRIVDAGDGWYAWEINAADFPCPEAATAQSIDIIIPRNTVVGTLYLDWQSFAIVDAYETDPRFETATKYENGEKLNGGANYVLPTPIYMSELSGKALRFEFKFETETGSFAFSLMEYAPWLRLTNTVTITKTASGFTVTDDGTNKACGRIVDAGDGWYAWEINAEDFPGSGAATAQMIDIIVPRNTVEGTLYLDWQSFAVVDAYDNRIEKATKYENGDKLNGGNNYVLPTPISVSELSGKALRWEFKFEGETGSFAFSLLQYSPWLAFTNIVTITKTASGFTVTDSDGNKPCGRIVDAGNGWYAWEINAEDFPGSGAATAQVIDLIVPRNTVAGTLYLNLNSMTIVDEYDSRDDRATKMEAGASAKQIYFKNNAQIAITDLVGKAIQVDFKPADDSQGELFRFSLHAAAWNNMTGTVVISRSGDTITANEGIIVDSGNGWYSWQLCHALFMGDGSNKPNATNVTFLYTGTITCAVYIDGLGVKVVNAYDKTPYATQFAQGDTLSTVTAKRIINKSDWNNTWSGFNLYLEFKFENEADGELFRFGVCAASWGNVTATIVISKNGDTVTSNRGQVIALEDGWYAWVVSADAFEGAGAAAATDITYIASANQPIAASKVWILPYLKAIPVS